MHRGWIACLSVALVAGSLAQGQADLQELDAALLSPVAAKREQALDRLIEARDMRSERLPRIAHLLDDPDLAVAGKAATALALSGTRAFPTITEMLTRGTPQQRWGATVALYKSTADIRPFVPALTRQLAQQDDSLVRASLAALTRVQSAAASAEPALRVLLAHEEPEIRWATLGTLGAIGSAAHDAMNDIAPFLYDPSAELRLAAADALKRIQPPAPISANQLAAYVDWVREHVPELMSELHVPGVSIAFIQQGEVRWTQGFGVGDARTRTPVTVDTIFEACSMSKPILALVALQLVQEGRLDLDRPLVEYLGHDYLPDQPGHRHITARMALTHRTGFSNWRMGYDEMGGPLALLFPPGSESTYSGEGILFLQRAIEAITGDSLDRLSDERLFAPLGLDRTSFVWSEAVERDLASGHREDGTFQQRTRYRKANGAYSLYTTPSEYARLMLTLKDPHLLGSHALTRESIELMLGRHQRVDDGDAIPRPGRARSVATYRALGWSLDVTSEGDILRHTGSNSSGFKSFGQLNPAKGSGLVIFANGDNGSRLREVVVERIGDL
jgi:CubicO group peptidase (beta-lactamase class C family)